MAYALVTATLLDGYGLSAGEKDKPLWGIQMAHIKFRDYCIYQSVSSQSILVHVQAAGNRL